MAPPNREIDFAFVSCSCRACERAGEAKLRGRVRGVPPHRWASGLQIVRLLRGTSRVKVAAMRVGFKPFCPKSVPFCSDFVHSHVGFKGAHCRIAVIRVGFKRSMLDFVHRHVGFMRF